MLRSAVAGVRARKSLFHDPTRSLRNSGNVLFREITQDAALPSASSSRELFVAPMSGRRHVFAYLAAATQIVFWGNLAHWAATGYAKKNEDTGEYELASPKVRYLYGGWLAGLGLVFAYVFMWGPSRVITRVAFMPGSKTLLIEAPHMWLPFSKVRVVSAPVQKFRLSTPVYSGKGPFGTSPSPNEYSYIHLMIEGRRFGYALNREGEFKVPAKTFDSLFAKSSVNR